MRPAKPIYRSSFSPLVSRGVFSFLGDRSSPRLWQRSGPRRRPRLFPQPSLFFCSLLDSTGRGFFLPRGNGPSSDLIKRAFKPGCHSLSLEYFFSLLLPFLCLGEMPTVPQWNNGPFFRGSPVPPLPLSWKQEVPDVSFPPLRGTGVFGTGRMAETSSSGAEPTIFPPFPTSLTSDLPTIVTRGPSRLFLPNSGSEQVSLSRGPMPTIFPSSGTDEDTFP